MSTVLLILLLMLKILGIIFLSILSLILLLLILVLFVPVRYKAKFDLVDKDINFYANGSWLLKILSVTYKLNTEKPLSIRIFGFSINLDKEKKTKEKSKKKNRKKRKSIEQDAIEDSLATGEDIDTVESEDSSINTGSDIEKETLASKAEEYADSSDEELTVSKINNEATNNEVTDKEVIETLKKDTEKETKSDTYKSDKIENTDKKSHSYDKIKKKLEVIKSDEFKAAFELCKKQLLKMLKTVLPRKWYIDAKVGFDDPATTGSILAVNGMLYPLIHNHVQLVGDFENEVIDVHGKFIGSVTLFKLACSGIKIYFNKNIKKIIKSFKEA